ADEIWHALSGSERSQILLADVSEGLLDEIDLHARMTLLEERNDGVHRDFVEVPDRQLSRWRGVTPLAGEGVCWQHATPRDDQRLTTRQGKARYLSISHVG